MRNRARMLAMASVLGYASSAFAASGAEYEGNSLLLFLFFGLGGLVVAFQFVPGLVMLYSMLKGALTAPTLEASPEPAHNKK